MNSTPDEVYLEGHPDAAFSRDYYVRPQGIEGEICRHWARRQAVGPYPGTPRRNFMVIVDACQQCSRILRTVGPDLSWRQYDWVRRWNSALEGQA